MLQQVIVDGPSPPAVPPSRHVSPGGTAGWRAWASALCPRVRQADKDAEPASQMLYAMRKTANARALLAMQVVIHLAYAGVLAGLASSTTPQQIAWAAVEAAWAAAAGVLIVAEVRHTRLLRRVQGADISRAAVQLYAGGRTWQYLPGIPASRSAVLTGWLTTTALMAVTAITTICVGPGAADALCGDRSAAAAAATGVTLLLAGTAGMEFGSQLAHAMAGTVVIVLGGIVAVTVLTTVGRGGAPPAVAYHLITTYVVLAVSGAAILLKTVERNAAMRQAAAHTLSLLDTQAAQAVELATVEQSSAAMEVHIRALVQPLREAMHGISAMTEDLAARVRRQLSRTPAPQRHQGSALAPKPLSTDSGSGSSGSGSGSGARAGVPNPGQVPLARTPSLGSVGAVGYTDATAPHAPALASVEQDYEDLQDIVVRVAQVRRLLDAYERGGHATHRRPASGAAPPTPDGTPVTATGATTASPAGVGWRHPSPLVMPPTSGHAGAVGTGGSAASWRRQGSAAVETSGSAMAFDATPADAAPRPTCASPAVINPAMAAAAIRRAASLPPDSQAGEEAQAIVRSMLLQRYSSIPFNSVSPGSASASPSGSAAAPSAQGPSTDETRVWRRRHATIDRLMSLPVSGGGGVGQDAPVMRHASAGSMAEVGMDASAAASPMSPPMLPLEVPRPLPPALAPISIPTPRQAQPTTPSTGAAATSSRSGTTAGGSLPAALSSGTSSSNAHSAQAPHKDGAGVATGGIAMRIMSPTIFRLRQGRGAAGPGFHLLHQYDGNEPAGASGVAGDFYADDAAAQGAESQAKPDRRSTAATARSPVAGVPPHPPTTRAGGGPFPHAMSTITESSSTPTAATRPSAVSTDSHVSPGGRTHDRSSGRATRARSTPSSRFDDGGSAIERPRTTTPRGSVTDGGRRRADSLSFSDTGSESESDHDDDDDGGQGDREGGGNEEEGSQLLPRETPASSTSDEADGAGGGHDVGVGTAAVPAAARVSPRLAAGPAWQGSPRSECRRRVKASPSLTHHTSPTGVSTGVHHHGPPLAPLRVAASAPNLAGQASLQETPDTTGSYMSMPLFDHRHNRDDETYEFDYGFEHEFGHRFGKKKLRTVPIDPMAVAQQKAAFVSARSSRSLAPPPPPPPPAPEPPRLTELLSQHAIAAAPRMVLGKLTDASTVLLQAKSVATVASSGDAPGAAAGATSVAGPTSASAPTAETHMTGPRGGDEGGAMMPRAGSTGLGGEGGGGSGDGSGTARSQTHSVASGGAAEFSQAASAAGSDDEDDERPTFGLHVLVVDDEAVNRRIAARFLTRLGCTSQVVSDGDEIVEALVLSDRPFDVVLLDILMRRTNGLDVCKNLRQQHVEIPIIAATANYSAKEAAIYRLAGFDRVLQKPFTLADLADALSHAFDIQAGRGMAPVTAAGAPTSARARRGSQDARGGADVADGSSATSYGATGSNTSVGAGSGTATGGSQPPSSAGSSGGMSATSAVGSVGGPATPSIGLSLATPGRGAGGPPTLTPGGHGVRLVQAPPAAAGDPPPNALTRILTIGRPMVAGRAARSSAAPAGR